MLLPFSVPGNFPPNNPSSAASCPAWKRQWYRHYSLYVLINRQMSRCVCHLNKEKHVSLVRNSIAKLHSGLVSVSSYTFSCWSFDYTQRATWVNLDPVSPAKVKPQYILFWSCQVFSPARPKDLKLWKGVNGCAKTSIVKSLTMKGCEWLCKN
jgi:hypothetical protein